MVELDNHPDFVKIEYLENGILKIDDKYGNHMEFHNLPQFVFDEFKESDFSYNFLEDEIINNTRLGYTKNETLDIGDIYLR